jgi:hypothetical protein
MQLYGNTWPYRAWIYTKRNDEKRIDNYLSAKRIFFILGTGRSGTQFITRLLKNDDSVCAYHEPDRFEDRSVISRSYIDADFASHYIKTFRKYQIYRRMMLCNSDIYGEVTGTLRYHASQIKSCIPGAKIYAVVRNPADVIRSIMQWDFYKKVSYKNRDVIPGVFKQNEDEWNSLPRLEKVCWMWADSYRRLTETIEYNNFLKFEEITSNYEYLSDKFLQPMGINIDKALWLKVKDTKSDNASKKYTYPHSSEWTDEEKEKFNSICGDMIQLFGYKNI